MNMEKKIVIVTYQFSVVVKGIEKELTNEGYEVELIDSNLEGIQSRVPETDLFLLYLADNFVDHAEYMKGDVYVDGKPVSFILIGYSDREAVTPAGRRSRPRSPR